jgi:hypothetical protein
MNELKVGDRVIFVRTIWEGRQGVITQLRDGRIRVNIPGTWCRARHEYSVTAVVKVKEEK